MTNARLFIKELLRETMVLSMVHHGFPRGRLRVESLDVAGERHGFHEQAVDTAIAEAGDVTQFRRAVEDFDGKRVGRVVRFGPERQPCARGESKDFCGSVVIAEAGDGEGLLGDVARAHGWPVTWRRRTFPASRGKGQ